MANEEKRLSRAAFLVGAATVAVSTFVARDAAASWKPYLDALFKNSGNDLKSAAIFGQDGTVWYGDSSIRWDRGEVTSLVAGVMNVAKFHAAGINYAGVKYMFLQVVEGVVVGRKGPTSVLLRTSKKALVLGLTKDGAAPARSIGAINALVTELVSKGF